MVKDKLYNSRLADKIVLRMPDGMRPQLKRLAAEQNISMNTLVINNLDAALTSGDRQRILLDALQEKLTRADRLLVALMNDDIKNLDDVRQMLRKHPDRF